MDSGTCDLRITDLKRNEIDMSSHCNSQKPCVVKCCPENEVFYADAHREECKNIKVLKKEFNHNMEHINFNYSELELFKDDSYDVISSKKYMDFTILYSDLYMSNQGCALWKRNSVVKMLEKGTLLEFMPNYYHYWMPVHTPNFCVDMVVGLDPSNKTLLFKFHYRIKINNKDALEAKLIFTVTGMLTSTFFLFLVLVVYSILHQLRNIQGMLLYAYVATLMGVYLLKASVNLKAMAQNNSDMDKDIFDCTVLTQIIYFLFLASFFWLKLMSFDIWWTFRGSRKLREIHRRGINVKMMIYASYAFGVPAAITIFAVIMDDQKLPPHVAKPMFNQCFVTDTTFVYLYVPLMILTGCNCLLYLMTMYNIWLIRTNLAIFDKAAVKKNKNNQNTFLLYIKLSSIMGVSWVLELAQTWLPEPDSIPFWLYVLLNAYNMFLGVIIFFFFVFKRNILMMLCKRFNIKQWRHPRITVNSSTGTELSKGSKYSRTNSRTKSTSETEL